MKAKKVFGCLGLGLLGVVLLVAVLVGIGIAVLKSPLVPVRVTQLSSLAKGEVRLEIPDTLWQKEVAAMFPITEDVAGFVKLHLRNPRFVPDGDQKWLRVQLELEAQVVQGGNERFPGQAVLRTQLKFDRTKQAVLLSNAQLVEFTFTGQAGKLVDSLRAALAEAVSAELDGFAVVELSKDGDRWQQLGLSYLREVGIEGGKVVVVLGK